jgi:alpha-tubulin suppressor-like RCC1 family protein
MVLSWGNGEEGKLGHGDMLSKTDPQVVEALSGTRIISIGCGTSISAALSDKEQVFVWGKTRTADLVATVTLVPAAVSDISGDVISIDCGNHHVATLSGAGGVRVWLGNACVCPNVAAKISAIACKGDYVVMLSGLVSLTCTSNQTDAGEVFTEFLGNKNQDIESQKLNEFASIVGLDVRYLTKHSK